MSIQIIDGFKLNVSKPVDDRFVTSGTSSRNSIVYKYEGLRVFDTVNKAPYVWLDGIWKKESETSVVSGSIPGLSGTVNKLVKFTDADKIGDSSIFDNGSRIGIGTITPDPNVKLDVNGNVKAAAFQGQGTYLTDINASNISNGTLAIARIQNGGTNQVLASGTSGPQWINISTLSTSTIPVTNDTTSTSDQYVNFTSTTSGASAIKVSSDGILFNPANGQMLLKSTNEAKPAYAFTGNSDTGIYRLPSEKAIGFSTSGTAKMVIKADGKVGIGTKTPFTSLHVVGQVDNANISTSNTAGQIFVSDPDSIGQGLLIGYAYYPSNYEYARIQTQGNFTLALQEKGGVVKIGQVSSYYDFTNLLDVNGQTRIRGAAIVGGNTGDAQVKVGLGRTSNGNTFVDLVSETTGYTDYGLRFIRWGSDPSILGVSQIVHKGTQRFDILAEQNAPIIFYTTNVERIRINNQGIMAQNGSAAAPSYYFGSETSTGIYRPSSNTIGFSVAGTERVKIYNEGIDISANGAGLKLKALTQGQNTYIEFFGKGILGNGNSTARSAYVGFSDANGVNDNFVIYNAKTTKYISVGTQIDMTTSVYVSGEVSASNTFNFSDYSGAKIKYQGTWTLGGVAQTLGRIYLSPDGRSNFSMFNASPAYDSPQFLVQNNSGSYYMGLLQVGAPSGVSSHQLRIAAPDSTNNFAITMKAGSATEESAMLFSQKGIGMMKYLLRRGYAIPSGVVRWLEKDYGSGQWEMDGNASNPLQILGVEYDTIVTVVGTSGANITLIVQVWRPSDSSWFPVGQSSTAITSIIPANTAWRLYCLNSGGSSTQIDVSIIKVGAQGGFAGEWP